MMRAVIQKMTKSVIKMASMKRLSERFRQDRRGNIAVTAAFALPLIMGGLAMGADASMWFVQKSGLTFDTDGAAITATNMYNRGMSKAAIEAALKKRMVDDGYPDTLNVNVDISAGGERVEVGTDFPGDKGLTAVAWSRGQVTIRARSVVQMEGGPVCLLALDPSPLLGGAFSMTGNASATLDGCMAASNSVHPSNGMSFGGSSSLTVDCLYSAGGISGESGRVTKTCATNKEKRNPVPDPFEGKSQPTPTTSCGSAPNTKPNSSVTLSPGCYNGNMDLKGTVKFNPGVYFIKDTSFSINSNADISGTDVTFVLVGSTALDFKGNATIALKAPTDATVGAKYPGVLFWGSSTTAASHTINGGANSKLQGVMYFPAATVDMRGGADMDVGCSRVVANRISLSGNSGFDVDCAGMLGNYPMTAAAEMKIVD